MLPRSALSILLFYLILVLLILAGTWALITQDWVRQQKSRNRTHQPDPCHGRKTDAQHR